MPRLFWRILQLEGHALGCLSQRVTNTRQQWLLNTTLAVIMCAVKRLLSEPASFLVHAISGLARISFIMPVVAPARAE